MVTLAERVPRAPRRARAPLLAPLLLTGAAFVLLYWTPLAMLWRDWWDDPEAGHGLLLAPLAAFLAWKRGRVPARPQPLAGLALIAGAAFLRYLSGVAVEWYTMRLSMLSAAIGLVVYWRGVRQVVHWWLPITLLFLSIPLPAVVLGALALPLQLQATRIGAALLELRDVPVVLAGNVLHLPPDRSLFVTEACSGLRSITALTALGVLIGGLWLRSPLCRIALVATALPVAVALNGVRVFLTGFLAYFVDPRLGDGFMHLSEGWLIFVVAFGILSGLAWLLTRVERLWGPVP